MTKDQNFLKLLFNGNVVRVFVEGIPIQSSEDEWAGRALSEPQDAHRIMM
jgi:hypothetical protein